MRVFMDRNGMYYMSEEAISGSDAEKPFVSLKLRTILENSPIPLNDEQLSAAIAALDNISMNS